MINHLKNNKSSMKKIALEKEDTQLHQEFQKSPAHQI